MTLTTSQTLIMSRREREGILTFLTCSADVSVAVVESARGGLEVVVMRTRGVAKGRLYTLKIAGRVWVEARGKESQQRVAAERLVNRD